MDEAESNIASTSKTPKERLFREKKFGTVVRALWPHKPALNLAQRTGDTERAASYWLAGEREVPARAFRAIFNEIME